jgi:hypothetical protein
MSFTRVHSRITGLPAAPREDRRNPLSANCAVQYRRCCGVCKHFSGEVIRTKALCAKINMNVDGGKVIKDCMWWVRK